MSAIDVVARMYDTPTQTAVKESDSAGTGFDQAIQTAIDTSAASSTCSACGAAAPVSSGTALSEASDVASDPETNRSAMYRFTVFVRVSGDMGAMSQTLAEEFKSLTRGFVSGLLAEKDAGVEPLDSFLGQAESVVEKGFESSKKMVDDMISAADYGLKSVIASMTSSSWMSSLGGNSSSGGLTGSSMADIAKLYLQDNINKGLTGSSSTGAVSYGGGFQLQKVSATNQPLKIVAADSEKTATTETTESTALSRKDKILERFLQLIDDISGAIGGKVIKASYSVSYYDSALSRDKEVKEPATAQVVEAVDEGSTE
ncbi:MAG: hypothetical protein ACD_39C00416G0003, partial [uncultured bacterium]